MGRKPEVVRYIIHPHLASLLERQNLAALLSTLATQGYDIRPDEHNHVLVHTREDLLIHRLTGREVMSAGSLERNIARYVSKKRPPYLLITSREYQQQLIRDARGVYGRPVEEVARRGPLDLR
jgi:hypothetical protein